MSFGLCSCGCFCGGGRGKGIGGLWSYWFRVSISYEL